MGQALVRLESSQVAAAARATRAWFENGWRSLGGELRDWLSADPASRRELAGTFPRGATVELFTAEPDGRWPAQDELAPQVWQDFLDKLCLAEGGALGAAANVRPGGAEGSQVRPGAYFETDQYFEMARYLVDAGGSGYVTLACKNVAGCLLTSRERQTALADTVLAAVQLVDPCYAEVSLKVDPTASALEAATGRLVSRALQESRRYLAGYSWITVVPREIAQRLGGAAAATRSDLFPEVSELRSGALWLRTTQWLDQYETADATSLAEFFGPVLPPRR
ncbi:hypothetical protein ACFQO7_32495 [Catellatospora aurea]|uniref:Uncharacterized protein n=1 Tax=Catellatospora aurea TaxID=1337874 RepID=A0ABW2H4M3_9ACTN